MDSCRLRFIISIIIFLLIAFFFNSSFAVWDYTSEIFTYNNNTYYCSVPSNVYISLSSCTEFNNTNYYYIVFTHGGGTFECQFVPKSLNVYGCLTRPIYPTGSGWYYFNWNDTTDTTGCVYYTFRDNGTLVSSTNGLITYSNSLAIYYENNSIMTYCTLPVYTDTNFTTLLFGEEPQADPEPVFVNAEDVDWGNSLVTGEFNYFFIDTYNIDYVSFTVYDITLIEQNYNINYDSFTQTFNLWELSNYLYDTTNGKFAIPKIDLAIGYFNSHDYRFVLSWVSNNDTLSKTFDITTDFSATAIGYNQEIENNQMYQDISSMSNFMQDDTFEEDSILDNMPNSDEFSDPSEGGLFTIFTALQNAFTNTSPTPVRFYIPFTNDSYIDLPPDLTISHLPSVILFLIQSVYWFIICRYIVKDISNTANKTKSGELLDSKDGNIRTDLL